ncbi:hypothetical protein CAP36_05740 [Chitinophagaceae bacterium IBVUCB2]|nr:hypothetical protein CAP36_05740 [Chitinophagaceae bacterium IBVUCB2]
MKVILAIFFLLFSISAFSQSLRDSLFSGKIKADTAKGTVIRNKNADSTSSKQISDTLRKIRSELDSNLFSIFIDSTVLISVDTSDLAIENAQKEWRKFIERWTPPLEQEQITKYNVPSGIYTVYAHFLINPDGVVKVLKIECPRELHFLEPILTKYYAKAPNQIPNHQGLIYRKTIRRQTIKFRAG